MLRILVVLGLGGSLLAVAPISRGAETERAPGSASNMWARRPLAVEGDVAFPTGSAVGLLGGMLDYAPVSWMSLTAGAGLGTSSPQVAAGVRVRPVMGANDAFSIGLGVSGGRHYYCVVDCKYADTGYSETHLSGLAEPIYVWTNVDLGFERRWPSGLLWRAYAGVSIRINKPAPYCSTLTANGASFNDCEGPTRWLPVIGSAVGYAF